LRHQAKKIGVASFDRELVHGTDDAYALVDKMFQDIRVEAS
jgi:hypothetical protein